MRWGWIRGFWVTWLAWGIMAGDAIAEPPPGDLAQVELLQNTLAEVAESASPSVVAIRASRPIDLSDRSEDHEVAPNDGSGGWGHPESEPAPEPRKFPAIGSGIVIRADGWVLTNEHVIQNANPEEITCTLHDGETYRVQEVMCDPRRDLAVLKIDAKGLKPARLGDLDKVRQGHFAIVLGNPFGNASESHGRPAMAFGIISAMGRGLTRQLDPLMPQRDYSNLIQTDAKVNPGNSGGPLLNIKGEVIGITTAISTRTGSSEGVGYAIPICPRTKQILEQLCRGEEVDYGFLGVGLRSATEADLVSATQEPIKNGAVIESVEFGKSTRLNSSHP